MSELQYSLDSLLRPQNWNEYIGQERIKKNLKILVRAARERNQMPEHVLLHGDAGLGKTTLAYIIGNELGTEVQTISGSMIKKTGDVISIVSTMEKGGVLFIDEIHCINKNIEEVLYPIMEDGKIDLIVGKGPTAHSVKLNLPPITIISATTQFGRLSKPLRSRFSGGVYKLDTYTEDELVKIIRKSAKKIGVGVDKESAGQIAMASRGVPRISNYLLKRIRDYCQVYKLKIDKQSIQETFKNKEIDEYGLTKEDKTLLEIILTTFNGGPVGINTLATIMSEDTSTIEEIYEPFLLQIGFLERTPKGRVITKKGEDYLADN